ncbi:hypothetical protein Bca4012_012180 [Brassica carinata]
MSLVDYDDSSSDDDVLPAAAEHKEALPQQPQPQPQQKLKSSPAPSITRVLKRMRREREELSQLPDALLLLESPRLTHASGHDHASVVAAAMAESALRKREFNGKSSSLTRRSKLPRGSLPHSKTSPDTLGNVLVPPQLKGRSNVATEDMSRLFVKKRQDSSKARSPNQE